MIKALFFDMDGTLVAYYPDGHGEIPMTSRKLLDELRKKGVMIFAATGRGRSEMETSPLFADMPFDAVLAMNGQRLRKYGYPGIPGCFGQDLQRTAEERKYR